MLSGKPGICCLFTEVIVQNHGIGFPGDRDSDGYLDVDFDLELKISRELNPDMECWEDS
jgi:hypothetical protein